MICVRLTGTLLRLSLCALAVTAFAMTVAEAGTSQADPAQHLLWSCRCFFLCSSSELALINPAGHKAAAQGWASSSLVVAKYLHQCPSLCLAWGALMVPSSSSLASRANRGMWDLILMTLSIAVGVPSGKSVKFIVIHAEDLMADLGC